jgi:hypothetical protein
MHYTCHLSCVDEGCHPALCCEPVYRSAIPDEILTMADDEVRQRRKHKHKERE